MQSCHFIECLKVWIFVFPWLARLPLLVMCSSQFTCLVGGYQGVCPSGNITFRVANGKGGGYPCPHLSVCFVIHKKGVGSWHLSHCFTITLSPTVSVSVISFAGIRFMVQNTSLRFLFLTSHIVPHWPLCDLSFLNFPFPCWVHFWCAQHPQIHFCPQLTPVLIHNLFLPFQWPSPCSWTSSFPHVGITHFFSAYVLFSAHSTPKCHEKIT